MMRVPLRWTCSSKFTMQRYRARQVVSGSSSSSGIPLAAENLGMHANDQRFIVIGRLKMPIRPRSGNFRIAFHKKSCSSSSALECLS